MLAASLKKATRLLEVLSGFESVHNCDDLFDAKLVSFTESQ